VAVAKIGLRYADFSPGLSNVRVDKEKFVVSVFILREWSIWQIGAKGKNRYPTVMGGGEELLLASCRRVVASPSHSWGDFCGLFCCVLFIRIHAARNVRLFAIIRHAECDSVNRIVVRRFDNAEERYVLHVLVLKKEESVVAV